VLGRFSCVKSLRQKFKGRYPFYHNKCKKKRLIFNLYEIKTAGALTIVLLRLENRRFWVVVMKCPYCSHFDTAVLDSRDSEDLASIRRRRECLKCEKRFTTYERVDTIDLVVLKKDGTREQFDRDKLLAGLMKATEKRSVGVEEIERTVDAIERELRRKDTVEIPSKTVGEIVMRKLRALDKVAYIRFASVYRSFEDVESFEKEIKSLLNKTHNRKTVTTN
jgi:transcriptional repressor NrdR